MELMAPIRVAAIIGTVCGIWLLQTAWRARNGNGLRLTLAWVLILTAFIVWSGTSGADKGVALGIVSLTLIALVFLGRAVLRASIREARPKTHRAVPTEHVSWPTVARRTFVGLLIGPVAGFSALAIASAGFVALHEAGAEYTANLVFAMFAFPLAWAGLAVIAGADKRLWRKSLVVLGLGLVPLAYLSFGT